MGSNGSADGLDGSVKRKRLWLIASAVIVFVVVVVVILWLNGKRQDPADVGGQSDVVASSAEQTGAPTQSTAVDESSAQPEATTSETESLGQSAPATELPTDSSAQTESATSTIESSSAVPSIAPTGEGSPVLPELAPVAPDQQVTTEGGISVRLTKIESVDGQAVAAGDIAGPAVRFTIELTNNSPAPLDLAYIVVNSYAGPNLDPADSLTAPGGTPFEGSLDPTMSATGTYLFNIPVADRGDVTTTIDYAAGKPAVVFRGATG